MRTRIYRQSHAHKTNIYTVVEYYTTWVFLKRSPQHWAATLQELKCRGLSQQNRYTKEPSLIVSYLVFSLCSSQQFSCSLLCTRKFWFVSLRIKCIIFSVRGMRAVAGSRCIICSTSFSFFAGPIDVSTAFFALIVLVAAVLLLLSIALACLVHRCNEPRYRSSVWVALVTAIRILVFRTSARIFSTQFAHLDVCSTSVIGVGTRRRSTSRLVRTAAPKLHLQKPTRSSSRWSSWRRLARTSHSRRRCSSTLSSRRWRCRDRFCLTFLPIIRCALILVHHTRSTVRNRSNILWKLVVPVKALFSTLNSSVLQYSYN